MDLTVGRMGAGAAGRALPAVMLALLVNLAGCIALEDDDDWGLPPRVSKPPLLLLDSYQQWWDEDGVLHFDFTLSNVGNTTMPSADFFHPKIHFVVSMQTDSRDAAAGDGDIYILDSERGHGAWTTWYSTETAERLGRDPHSGRIGPMQIHPGETFSATILVKPPQEFDFEAGEGFYSTSFKMEVWQPDDDGTRQTSDGSVRFSTGCFTRQSTMEYYAEDEPPEGHANCLWERSIRISPERLQPYYEHLM